MNESLMSLVHYSINNMSNIVHFHNNSEYLQRTAFQTFYYGYMLFCVATGLVGNCLVWLLIKYNRNLRQIPSNLYLLHLAFMSSLFLISLLVFWLEQEYFQRTIFHGSTWGCKSLNFIAHYCDFATIWLIVLMVAERFIVLHKKKRALTVHRAARQIKILLFVGFLYNFWILFVADVDSDGECDIDPEYEKLYQFFTTFETVFLLLLPSAIILFSNIFVVIKLQSYLKFIPNSPSVSFHTMSDSNHIHTTTTTAGRITTRSSLTSTQYSTIPESFHVQPRSRAKSKGQLKFADLQLTRSLLVVTWMFLILNIPNYAYRTMSNVFNMDRHSYMMQDLSLISHILLYTHHAFIFYFYIFYSPSMKRKLWPTTLQLLECYCLKPEPLVLNVSNDIN